MKFLGTPKNPTDVAQFSNWVAYGQSLAALAYNRTGVMSGCAVVQHNTAATLAYRANATAVGTNVTSQAIVIPSSVQTGDLLLLAVMTTAAAVTSHNTPSGWTLVRTDTGSGGFPVKQTIFQRTATPTDAGSTVTFSFTGGTGANTIGTMLAYPGVDSINAQAATGSGSAGITATAPSVTTNVNGCQIVEIFASVGDTSPQSITNPATSRVTTNNGGYFAGSAADQAQGTAGATGTHAATLAQSGAWVAVTIALAPQVSVPNMSVDTAAGVISSAGLQSATIAQNNVTVTTADSTNTRYDLVTESSAGVVVVTAGIAAANPVWPAIPANSVPLALITVTAGKTSILNADITDLRTILGSIKSAASRTFAYRNFG